jgi:hypothetical protein
MRHIGPSKGSEGGFSATADPVPKFLYLDFHLRFFPQVLRRRLRGKAKEGGVSFTSTLEATILLAACVVLALIGLPSAITRGSIVGYVFSILGVGGAGTLFVWSVASSWGSPAGYDQFSPGVFFFFVLAGIFVGIPVGLSGHSFLLGVSLSLAGLVAGYPIGIFSGRQAQRLGWISTIVDMLAGLAAVGLAGAALIMLFALAAG